MSARGRDCDARARHCFSDGSAGDGEPIRHAVALLQANCLTCVRQTYGLRATRRRAFALRWFIKTFGVTDVRRSKGRPGAVTSVR